MPQLSTKNKLIVLTIYTALVFAAGKYGVPQSVKKEEAKTTVDNKTQVVKENTKADLNKDRHVETITTRTVLPSGEKTTVVKRIEDDTDKSKHEIVKNDNSITKDISTEKSSTETVFSSSKVTVGALVSVNPFQGTPTIDYGLSVQKPFLNIGPFDIGAQLQFYKSGTCGGGVTFSW